MAIKKRLLLIVLKHWKPSNKFLDFFLKVYIRVSCVILKNIKQRNKDIIILKGDENKFRNGNIKHYDNYLSLSSSAFSESIKQWESYCKDSHVVYKGIPLDRLLEIKTVGVIFYWLSQFLISESIWMQEGFEEAW